VLRGFDLAIPAGRVAAFVGPNGAGKSTIVKLLCRFYDPDQGAIEIDGVDLREFSLESVRRRVTVLFQEPARYNDTAAENVALGNIFDGLGLPQIEAAVGAAGAAGLCGRLPQGLDTLLGTSFLSGTQLSTGEWQQIALARAFIRDALILILDEPTSAMDSWAEIEWLAHFRSLAQGRTVILITHRFTTAMHADIIYVVANGRITESGSHAELVGRGGVYAQSWNAQTAQVRPTAP